MTDDVRQAGALFFFPTHWEADKIASGAGFRSLSRGGLHQAERGHWRIFLRLCGIGQERAALCARQALAGPPPIHLVVLAGFAGALSPEARPGDLLIDLERSDRRVAERFLRRCKEKGLPARLGKFLSAERTLNGVAEKASLRRSSGADAVELEGEAVRQAARERGIPFLSLRAVSDGHDQALPSAVGRLDDAGRPGIGFWFSLLSHPEEWIDFIRLWRTSRRALGPLRAAVTEILAALAEGHLVREEEVKG